MARLWTLHSHQYRLLLSDLWGPQESYEPRILRHLCLLKKPMTGMMQCLRQHLTVQKENAPTDCVALPFWIGGSFQNLGAFLNVKRNNDYNWYRARAESLLARCHIDSFLQTIARALGKYHAPCTKLIMHYLCCNQSNLHFSWSLILILLSTVPTVYTGLLLSTATAICTVRSLWWCGWIGIYQKSDTRYLIKCEHSTVK